MRKSPYLDWALAQYFIMASVFALGLLCAGNSRNVILTLSGIILILISAAFGIAGVAVLGKNRKSTPEPSPESELVTKSVYSIVRHPLYFSLICLSFGWSLLFVSVASAMASLVLAVFLDRKARLEEKLLSERFPEYQDYMKKTYRLIPWIY